MGARSSVVALVFAARELCRAGASVTLRSLSRRRLFIVRGRSMEPSYREGDWVLVRRPVGKPPIGSVVVARVRRLDTIAKRAVPSVHAVVIKRVRSHGATTVALGSDNPIDATDSREFGSIESSDIIGIVILSARTGASALLRQLLNRNN